MEMDEMLLISNMIICMKRGQLQMTLTCVDPIIPVWISVCSRSKGVRIQLTHLLT